MKTLNQQVVYQACEFLLHTQFSIAAVEVQQNLLNNGYEQDFDYVQDRIHDFAADENWLLTATGRYQFRDDTNDGIDTVLCKGAQMVKIHVLDKVLTIKYLHNRKQDVKEYHSNRQAIFWATEKIKRLITNGYYKK